MSKDNYPIPNINFDGKYKIQTISHYLPPLLTLGFQLYYSDNIDRYMKIKKTIATSVKNYKIINRYNCKFMSVDLNDDTNDMYHAALIKFKKIDNNLKYINKQEFYKIWEILKTFNIINKSSNVLCLDDFSNFTSNIICNNVKQITYNDTSKLDNGKTEKYDCIIDSSITKISLTQEQEFMNNLINLAHIIKHIKNNGNMIFKFYNIFTLPTFQLLYLIRSCFKTCNIYIPLTCQEHRNEKYMICFGYKENKVLVKLFDELYNLLINKNTDVKLMNLNVNIDDEYRKFIIDLNIKIMITQIKYTSAITSYIENSNYHGVEYNKYLSIQHEKTKEWIKAYF